MSIYENHIHDVKHLVCIGLANQSVQVKLENKIEILNIIVYGE